MPVGHHRGACPGRAIVLVIIRSIRRNKLYTKLKSVPRYQVPYEFLIILLW